MRWWLLIVGIVALSASIGAKPAYSHRPRLVEGNSNFKHAYRIEDAETSWALYGDLEKARRVEYFTFTVKAGAPKISPELLVPDESQFDGFKPTFVLFGAALTGVTEPAVSLPAGMQTLAARRISEHEFESFTRKSFRKTATLEATLAPGEYGIAIFSDDSHTGEYVLALGTDESFSADDFGPMVTGCGTIFY